ncbi:MAG: hypothetical protein ACKVOH_04565, partial [Chlamydiales bacterium]
MVSEKDLDMVKALKNVLAMYDIDLEEEVIQKDEKGKEDVDYSEVISKTQAKLDELTQQAEQIYAKTG